MKLYIKPWCPWCIEAVEWFKVHGIQAEVIDVTSSKAGFDEMVKISGQSKAPTLQLSSGEVLPDFDTRQLESFFKAHGIAF